MEFSMNNLCMSISFLWKTTVIFILLNLLNDSLHLKCIYENQINLPIHVDVFWTQRISDK